MEISQKRHIQIRNIDLINFLCTNMIRVCACVSMQPNAEVHRTHLSCWNQSQCSARIIAMRSKSENALRRLRHFLPSIIGIEIEEMEERMEECGRPVWLSWISWLDRITVSVPSGCNSLRYTESRINSQLRFNTWNVSNWLQNQRE